jgi:hypothetical protein
MDIRQGLDRLDAWEPEVARSQIIKRTYMSERVNEVE